MFFAHSCVYFRTPLANIREQTTYYYYSAPGQEKQALCVQIVFSQYGDGLCIHIFSEGFSEGVRYRYKRMEI